MKKIIFFLIVSVALTSCATIDLKDNVPIGRFNVKGDLYYEELELKPDSSFSLKVQETHTTRNCEGEWEVKSKDELILNGMDTKESQGADSLFYKKLDCKNLLLRFESKNKIARENYHLKRMK